MDRFGSFMKRARKEAGLSQQQAAEKMGVSKNAVQNWESGATKVALSRVDKVAFIYNIPVNTLYEAMSIEEDTKTADAWPDFLFDEDTNEIVSSLHLNRNQQELFGLLYIYDAEYLKNREIGFNTFYDDLKRIPYGFIEKVGSIQFMNIAEGLHHVLKYVKTDFLLKVLRVDPEAELDMRTLPKDLICEFIDTGHKRVDIYAESERYDSEGHEFEGEEELDFRFISMRVARTILPILDKGDVHIADGWWSNGVREDVPPELKEICGRGYEDGKEVYVYLESDIRKVADFKNIAAKGEEEQWWLSINETGRRLLEWFHQKE